MDDKIDPELARKNLIAKALGVTNAISKFSSTERNQNPSGTFGRDYNNMRRLVIDYFPELEVFCPPDVHMEAMYAGGQQTRESFAEVYTFYEQIYQLLSGQGG